MRPNVKLLVELLTQAGALPAPVVDIGALRTPGQEDYADLRPYFGGAGCYTGVDMRRGPGVDALASIHHLPLRPGALAGTLLALDTLEHVLDPLVAARELTAALAPGGVAVITSHMNFPVHAHPSDYWRFTPMAFDRLLGTLDARYIFAQGDAENPHTVIGIAARTCGDPARAEAFASAVHGFEARWPEDGWGGPLVPCEASALDLSQRGCERMLPEVTQAVVVEQTFTARAADLCRIDVRFTNHHAERSLRHLVLRLRDEGGREWAAHRVLAWHVIDDGWLAMPVPPGVPAGARLTLRIESPDATPGTGVQPRASAARAAVAAFGDLRVDGAAVDGTLAMQTYVRAAPPADDVQVGEATLATGRPFTAAPAPPAHTAADAQWEQTRYLAATTQAGLDGIREQLRTDAVEQRALLERTLEASTERVLARLLRENAAMRALRRLRGK